jgi:hypothetical protein
MDFRWPRNDSTKRFGLKKDRIACTTRSKSREETPKEGMDRNNLSDCQFIVRCTNVNRASPFFNSLLCANSAQRLDQHSIGAP